MSQTQTENKDGAREQLKPGPKPIVLDHDQVSALAKRGWKNDAIASFFKISKSTLETRFSEPLKAGRLNRAATIMDLAWKRAHAGSDKIIMLLLKNECGYTEKTIHEVNGNIVTEVKPSHIFVTQIKQIIQDKSQWEKEVIALPEK